MYTHGKGTSHCNWQASLEYAQNAQHPMTTNPDQSACMHACVIPFNHSSAGEGAIVLGGQSGRWHRPGRHNVPHNLAAESSTQVRQLV
jgi:hypothetical protein